jgi:hypothetical protein
MSLQAPCSLVHAHHSTTFFLFKPDFDCDSIAKITLLKLVR